MGSSVTRSFTIVNEKGMHARAAVKLAKVAAGFPCNIVLSSHAEQGVNAKSVMGVLLLVAAKGSVVEVSATGERAGEAIEAIGQLIADRFGEPE